MNTQKKFKNIQKEYIKFFFLLFLFLQKNKQNKIKIFKKRHYFSPTYPLSLCRKKIVEKEQQNDIFCWNQNIQKQLFQQNTSNPDQNQCWSVQIIQGYVGQFIQALKNKQNLSITLICRRSFKRGGTRYIHRGADSNGFVANYCENELLVEYKDQMISYLSIRGSVPLFWEQKGFQAQLRITRGEELNTEVCKKHFDYIRKSYGNCGNTVEVVNLMLLGDKQEQILSEKFESNLNGTEGIEYVHFDFHKRADDLDEYVYDFCKKKQEFGFLVENNNNEEIIEEQKGIYRINCKDCLDRTNSFMMRVCFWTLMDIIKNLNVSFLDESEFQTLMSGLQVKGLFDKGQNSSFVNQFKQLWIENGNNISKLYAGTDSTTKNASKGLKFKMDCYLIGIKRFVNGNIKDSFKMKCLNYIMGQNQEQQIYDYCLPDDVNQQLIKKKNEYIKQVKLNIQIITWNVMNLNSDKQIILDKFFDTKGQNNPDIIVIGLQEIVKQKKFKIQNIFQTNHDINSVQQWTQIVTYNLKNQLNDNYILVDSHDMVGNLLLIYAKDMKINQIKNIEHDSIKCGFAKKVGNVGGTVCRFEIDDVKICFVNCFLTSGRNKKKVEERFEILNQIHNTAFQKDGMGKVKGNLINTADIIFVFGDLNFRVDMEYKVTQEIIQSYQYLVLKQQIDESYNMIKQLLKKDQFSQNYKNDSIMKDYFEQQINFPPNFNDSSKKNRTSSWRGRILIKTKEENNCFEQLFYCSNYTNQFSDHSSVSGYFVTQTEILNEEKRQQIIEEIFKEKNIQISDNIAFEDTIV
ncbi:hypothetical protein IMG5_133450 [Ichthyophthirius multifiliis]|uniref:phosphoinositide 5-phosphatase n=1 Tax=Ichthyophthirius multifiliis TaxID=5932 RepID=G0QWN1_ICHMU|nr:hypothetical protein IMG5_133450 [Ichthyophthirius multifiliis]EGR30378.1 hypothetical protein IMG5_133450 [Ichthyophthirius multifiliis]|eukprot:XP_004031965.1 hypothetical protein IMG5_133450 [Ichthyophthirius multifiliis]